jgi:hypothetical protein
MESQWYIHTESGEVEGPLSPVMLKARADSGAIGPDTPVRNGAEGKWLAATRVKGLFPSSPVPPPPPVAPLKIPSAPLPPRQASLLRRLESPWAFAVLVALLVIGSIAWVVHANNEAEAQAEAQRRKAEAVIRLESQKAEEAFHAAKDALARKDRG